MPHKFLGAKACSSAFSLIEAVVAIALLTVFFSLNLQFWYPTITCAKFSYKNRDIFYCMDLIEEYVAKQSYENIQDLSRVFLCLNLENKSFLWSNEIGDSTFREETARSPINYQLYRIDFNLEELDSLKSEPNLFCGQAIRVHVFVNNNVTDLKKIERSTLQPEDWELFLSYPLYYL